MIHNFGYSKYWYLTHPWLFIRDLKSTAHHFVQRGSRGYADSDIWSFDDYIQRVLTGGLKELSKNPLGYPDIDGMTHKKWKETLKKMQSGFQAVIDYEDKGFLKDKGFKKMKLVYKEREESLKLLIKYFGALWD